MRTLARWLVLAGVLSATGLPAAWSGDAMRNFDCPGSSPNCVSSDAQGARAVEPLRIRGGADAAWQALQRRLEQTERVKVVTSEPGYLRAEFSTRLLRFTDDVEFELRPELGTIAVRSASRVGYYDFGANRRRVEALRQELRSDGVVE